MSTSWKLSGWARFSVAAIPLLLAISLAGCTAGRSNEATLSGSVSYKGQPVTGGSITFHPVAGGAPYPGILKPDGSFSFGGVPIGQMEVAIETESVKSMPGASGSPYHMPGGGKPNQQMPNVDTSNMPTYVKIPAKYANPKTSGLTVNVKAGSHKVNFDLTD